MASPFQQQSTTRKFIYFGLIVALFTVSLVHRKTIINARADELLLRDLGRGKADLTDSALRLTLSGARGIAVTSLWLSAMDKQKRHEWNELEVLVDSLTRLQPRFTSPWLFQSWNLAFNVAVECDRPRDKYYYVTRGITLLARGEEKNDPGQARPPQPWPANPEMRYSVGFYYQLKLGQSDEAKTMRCLFDLSCIPPAARNPEQFRIIRNGRPEVDLAKFREFCEKYPRLVRRLRERLKDFEKPEAIVEFLADNKDIPGRAEDRTKLDEDSRLDEFPALPPQSAKSEWPYPDWRSEVLGDDNEDFDVYICMRAWYTYAQIPLPPQNPEPSVDDEKYRFERLKHRLPRMTTVIFRGYPARAEEYFANQLQQDGWFDESGWVITDWFKDLPSQSKSPDLRVGDGRKKYSSQAAWIKAYEMYFAYGKNNGLYWDRAQRRLYEEEAARDGPGSPAANKVQASASARQLTNFDDFLFKTRVERTPEAIAARMVIYETERDQSNPDIATVYYEKVLPQWLDLLLRYPEFRQISEIQEDSYDLEAKYFKKLQYDVRYRPFFNTLVREVGLALPPLQEAILSGTVLSNSFKVMPIRNVEGPLDQLFVLEGAQAEVFNPLAQALARSVLWPPPPSDAKAPDFAFARFVVWPLPPGMTPGMTPEIGLGQHLTWPPQKPFVAPNQVAAAVGVAAAGAGRQPLFLMLSSAEQRKILTQLASYREPPAGQGWVPLISEVNMQTARERITWMRPRPSETPQPPPTPVDRPK
jgi:hypothetical protein